MHEHDSRERAPFRLAGGILLAGMLMCLPASCSPEPPSAEVVAEPAAEQPVDTPVAEPGALLPGLEEQVARNPSDVEGLLALARGLQEVGRWEEAVARFEQATHLHPAIEILVELGRAYTSVSRMYEARAVYQQILSQAPDHPRALHNLAAVQLGLDAVEEAEALYLRAVTVRPDYLLAWYSLGSLYRFHGRDQEASASFQRVLRLTPSGSREQSVQVESLVYLASIDVAGNRADRAVETMHRLLEQIPEHPTAHYVLGRALLQLGRSQEAEVEFDIHIRLLEQSQPRGPATTP